MSWRMPAETAAQDRVWMAFPPAGSPGNETAALLAQAHATWAAVANAIVAFEPVTMLVRAQEIANARALLAGEVELLEAPLDDAWMRDIGPTFVLDDEHGSLGAVDWIFNGWGAQGWAHWEHDQHVARLVAEHAGAQPIDSPIVNEGGGIHVDGLGTVLVTETVQLDPGRNPTLDHAAIEAELVRTLGAGHAIWLPRGLTRDSDELGTRGHVDMVATFTAPGRLLVHVQQNPEHPDHTVCEQILARLRASRDAAGNQLTLTELPAPAVLRDDEGPVDYSYINHLVINGAVIACGYEDPHDALATEILAAAYPGREIVMLDARPILARGGGIHCITQQQPAVGTAASTAPGAQATPGLTSDEQPQPRLLP